MPGEPLDKERSRICRKACNYIRSNPERQADHPKLSQIPLPAMVLDTNVVIDWLLFDDPSSCSLAAAIARRQVKWIATAAMRDELADVMERGLATKCGVEPVTVLARWDRLVEQLGGPAPLQTELALRCSDPDDQKFIDLALNEGAHWLLSRDHAVLKLKRPAAVHGLTISLPGDWRLP